MGTNGLSIEPSTSGTKTMKFKYRFFAYIPFKLSFDYKGNFTHSYQDFRFYIDDVQYLYQNSSSS
ncbi:MAG: hypothetical protein H6767_03720 [Candidatus Peribacteria bacterium]|nr:MAG: hypothetical protein H6767_03720 [Candidatus Peribacteria bacterium]